MTTPVVAIRRQVPTALAHAVRDRDGNRCTSCGVPIVGALNKHWSIWKRIPLVPRGMPETDPRICRTSNLVTVCGHGAACYRDLSRDPAAARRRGFRLSREQSPSEVPVLVWTGTDRGALELASSVTAYLLDDAGLRALAAPPRRTA